MLSPNTNKSFYALHVSGNFKRGLALRSRVLVIGSKEKEKEKEKEEKEKEEKNLQ